MTRKQRAIITTWSAVMIAGLAVLISSVGVGYVAMQNAHTSKCNKAWITKFNKAQNARLPFSDKQNAALLSAFQLLATPPGATPPKTQITDLQTKGAAFVGAAKAYEAAKDDNPYPTNTCPDSKAVHVAPSPSGGH